MSGIRPVTSDVMIGILPNHSTPSAPSGLVQVRVTPAVIYITLGSWSIPFLALGDILYPSSDIGVYADHRHALIPIRSLVPLPSGFATTPTSGPVSTAVHKPRFLWDKQAPLKRISNARPCAVVVGSGDHSPLDSLCNWLVGLPT